MLARSVRVSSRPLCTSNMEQEPKWKQILEFPNYYVSDGGLVINLARRKIRATVFAYGAEHVRLWNGGVVKQIAIHKLVKQYHGGESAV